MCSRHQEFFYYFILFVWQRLTYREPALSTGSVWKTAIISSSNKRPQLLKGFCSMHPGLVGEAAKVGRNNTNGVTHLTSKTLFESQSWEKNWGKPLAKFWHRRTCSYDKVGKKRGGGRRANVLTNLSSIQPVCRQKLGKRG